MLLGSSVAYGSAIGRLTNDWHNCMVKCSHMGQINVRVTITYFEPNGGLDTGHRDLPHVVSIGKADRSMDTSSTNKEQS